MIVRKENIIGDYMTINVIQDGDVYNISSPYDPTFINMVKSVPGRMWIPDSKCWMIPSQNLGWLLKAVSGTPYESALKIIHQEDFNQDLTFDKSDRTVIPDIDISDVDQYVVPGGRLYDHQLDFLKYAKNRGRHGFVLADDMGCISGDAVVTISGGGNPKPVTLATLYSIFQRYKDISVVCFKSDIEVFGLNRVRDVKFSGVKPVYMLTLADGRSIKATEDHEFLTPNGYIPLSELFAGDYVIATSEDSDGVFIIPKPISIKSIKYVGEEPTYDIVMEEPYRNFVANGIVVHNCGKTLEIINYALYQRKRYGYKHCLIIACINCAKYSWLDDIKKHTNGQEHGYILGSRKVTRGPTKGQIRYKPDAELKIEDLETNHQYGDTSADELPFFLITNIEALARVRSGKKLIVEEAIISQILKGNIPMIVIDECHKNMSPKSTQGKVILDIKKRTSHLVQWIPCTGTPIRNKPTDVFTPLKLVDAHTVKSYYKWNQQFCIFGGYNDYEILGYKNISLLKKMLHMHMIRREKSEVLDLPPKVYHVEYVENTPYQNKLYESVRLGLYKSRDEILGSMNPLSSMLRLRQVNGSPELVDEDLVINDAYIKKNAKLARLVELVDDIIESGEKVVIFSNWVHPLRTIYRFLSKKYKVCCYTGTMKAADREKHKQVFINNPEYKILLGTMDAMGASITLTVATNCIFYDDCWTPSDKEQCSDRLYRIGTTQSVNVYTILAKDTIDEYVYQILLDKKAISDFMVDGKLDLKKNPDLFEYLLGFDHNLLFMDNGE